jgi:hypothetical protein
MAGELVDTGGKLEERPVDISAEHDNRPDQQQQ